MITVIGYTLDVREGYSNHLISCTNKSHNDVLTPAYQPSVIDWPLSEYVRSGTSRVGLIMNQIYSDSNLVNLFAHLFEFFQFGVVHDLLKGGLI